MNKIFHQALKTFLVLALAVVLLLPESTTLALPQKAAPQAQDVSGGLPTDRIIIKYAEGASAQSDPSASAQMESLSAAAGVPLEYARAMSGDAHVLQLGERLPVEQVQAISANLMTLPGVEYAEPDWIKRPTLDPDDPGYDASTPSWWSYDDDNDAGTPDLVVAANQWHYFGPYGINAPAAWDITTGIESTNVAVIDTGITNHVEFAGRIVPGYDFIGYDYYDYATGQYKYYTANDGDGRDSNPTDSGDWVSTAENEAVGGFFEGCGQSDSSWHGTHVAGTIAANSSNGVGVAGINWNAKILPVRVLGKCGGYTSDIVDGMRWSAGLPVSGVATNTQYPAKVLNLSLGGEHACSTTEQSAINDIVNIKGAVVVVAAGNESKDASTSAPGNCVNVITVGATNKNGVRPTYSNYGAAVEISAPGGEFGADTGILSTSNGNTTTPNANSTYVTMQGTSMATPHVSGVVSLMFAVNQNITPAQVLSILQKTAKAFPVGSSCANNPNTCGSGIVDAGAAVALAQLPDLVITDVTITDAFDVVDAAADFGEKFKVKVTVKNQGGSVSGSTINTQIYVDRNPTSVYRTEAGCLRVPPYGEFDDDPGEFQKNSDSSAINAGQTTTFDVIINNPGANPPNLWTANAPVAWDNGTHDLYAYVDANCIVDEGFEDNNYYVSNPVEVNPFVEGALIYPKGTVGTDYNPTYVWNKVTGATWYILYVNGQSGRVVEQWFNASLICDDAQRTCSVSPGLTPTLWGGSFSWWVQPYSPAGYGSWSARGDFSTTVLTKPLAATNLSPTGSQGTNYTPTFTWNIVDGATWYILYVNSSAGQILAKWYPSTVCGELTCTAEKPVSVGGGSYDWWVQTYNSAGYGLWSAKATFATDNLSKPLAAVNLSPNGSAGMNYNPTFTWDKRDNASWYILYLYGPSGQILAKWYPSSVCVGSTCTADKPVALSPGNYTWWVQTYNSAGYGPWSAGASLVLTKALAATNLSPTGSQGTNYDPSFTWEKVDGVTWYILYLNGPTGQLLAKWYPSTICGELICTAEKPIMLGGGTYNWWVQTYNSAGYGFWSSQATFTTDTLSKPLAAVNLSPTGPQGTNYTPTFTWDKRDGVSWYILYLNSSAGQILAKWYPSTVCDDFTCTAEKPLTLGGGTYNWWVQTYNSAGYGPWSAQATFTTDALSIPLAAVNLSPTGTQGTNYTPTFTWDKREGASWYILYLNGSAGQILAKWYPSTICGELTCTAEKPVTLSGGTYNWWVQTYNSAGYGLWSSQATFYLTVPSAPAQVDLRATYLNEENKTVSYANPENGQNLATDYSPTFTWKKADGATWYIVYVYGSTGQLLAKWYPSTSICGDVSCMVERPITLAGGSYTWWVQTYNSVGYGPWSVGNIFTADVQTTPKATTLFTNGLPNINAKTKPIFAWSKVSQAISYRLYVKGPSGLVLDQWLQAKDVCVGNYCSLVSPVTLASGDHTWWVQTYNFAGYGPWRSAPFKVQSALSAPTSLALKAGEPSTKPIYTWTEVSTATKYHLYVVGPTYVIDKWYDSWTICASGVCSVQNPTVLDGGEHTWSVMPYNSMVGYGLWGSGMFMATP